MCREEKIKSYQTRNMVIMIDSGEYWLCWLTQNDVREFQTYALSSPWTRIFRDPSWKRAKMGRERGKKKTRNFVRTDGGRPCGGRKSAEGDLTEGDPTKEDPTDTHTRIKHITHVYKTHHIHVTIPTYAHNTTLPHNTHTTYTQKKKKLDLSRTWPK